MFLCTMNTASSRNEPTEPFCPTWERQYDAYHGARDSYSGDGDGRGHPVKAAAAATAAFHRSPVKQAPPTKHANVQLSKNEEAELRKLLHSGGGGGSSSRRSPKKVPTTTPTTAAAATTMLAYPSHWDVERIAIPDCDAVFLSSPICSKRAAVARQYSTTSSDQWMQDEKKAAVAYHHPHGETASPSATTPGCYSVQGPAHHRSMQSESAKYRELPQQQQPQRQQQHHQPRSSNERMEMEVSPGVYMPLHGSEETRQAARNGQLTACPCYNCDQQLHCVAIAVSVLCPHCREISPIFDSSTSCGGGGGGVGLGISQSEFNRWAEEEYSQFQQQQQPRQERSRYSDSHHGGENRDHYFGDGKARQYQEPPRNDGYHRSHS